MPAEPESQPGGGDDTAVAALLGVLTDRGDTCASTLKQALADADTDLESRFRSGESVDALLTARAASVDALIKALWPGEEAAGRAAVVAVGGYGRAELHPKSDVDIMILLADDGHSGEWLSDFLTHLWDSGLDVGHSVRTVADCEREARADLTIVTTLIEARLVTGCSELYAQMQSAIAPDRMWDSKAFFQAKRAEQRARHARYDDTAYKLEPNLKGSPGGLRDIQMIGWVTRRHFGASSFADLVGHGFLTEGQHRILMEGRSYLWRLRFALHMLTERAEDRLLFDHQLPLARYFGYEDARYTLAVEQMMQRYYRTVMDLSRLNEMLLQLFEEAILLDPLAEAQPLNERFKLRNGFLQTRGDDVFQREPSALLELFLLLQQNPEIRGVSAWTVGLIKRSLHLIDDEFRQSPKNHRLFLKIIAAPEGVTHELRRMNLYGVLGLYIPAFGRIVGRMQYDLFHAYTVDEHTLFVVSNLRRLALPRFDDELPECSQVMQRLANPMLAYLGGLFHDIAKGRGGDHSRLGAVDAEAFCLEHGLAQRDAELVAWLVRHHLLLSTTAQKKDLSDPSVIQKFASIVGDQEHLDLLYVLTVADVRGTNPKLWNSWKASLFHELYVRTSEALARGLENPAGEAELVAAARREALGDLTAQELSSERIEAVWATLPDEYFLRYSPEEIAWHTRALVARDDDTAALLDVASRSEGVAIFLYTPRRYHTFAHTTAILDELGLDVLDARILPADNGYSLDTYIVQEYDRKSSDEALLIADLQKRLAPVLERSTAPDSNWQPTVTRRKSRRARMFSTPTDIQLVPDDGSGRTVLELTTDDRPGLLMSVGEVFLALGIDIAMAKIVTVGERAEDVFYLSTTDGEPLSRERCEALADRLRTQLSRQPAT